MYFFSPSVQHRSTPVSMSFGLVINTSTPSFARSRIQVSLFNAPGLSASTTTAKIPAASKISRSRCVTFHSFFPEHSANTTDFLPSESSDFISSMSFSSFGSSFSPERYSSCWAALIRISPSTGLRISSLPYGMSG